MENKVIDNEEEETNDILNKIFEDNVEDEINDNNILKENYNSLDECNVSEIKSNEKKEDVFLSKEEKIFSILKKNPVYIYYANDPFVKYPFLIILVFIIVLCILYHIEEIINLKIVFCLGIFGFIIYGIVKTFNFEDFKTIVNVFVSFSNIFKSNKKDNSIKYHEIYDDEETADLTKTHIDLNKYHELESPLINV